MTPGAAQTSLSGSACQTARNPPTFLSRTTLRRHGRRAAGLTDGSLHIKKSALFLSSALTLGALTLGGLAPLSPVHAEGRPFIGSYEDRVAIEQLMWDYVRAADTLDEDAYAAVFTPDGAFNQVKGRDALKKMIADMDKSQTERRESGQLNGLMHHFMANQTIEFVNEDHARVHYYWQTVFAGRDLANPPRLAAAGRGVDDVVRVDGKWLIQSRNVAPDY